MRDTHSRLAGKYKKCAVLAACFSLLSTAAAEQFEAEVQSKSFTFRDGGLHNRKVTRVDGLLIAEHDMIMGIDAIQKRATKGLSNSTYGRLWPNGVVPFRMGPSLGEATKQKIIAAVDHWNSFNAITLVERTSRNASAYPNYIDFIYDNRCASWIGFQETGPQAIYTGDRCSTGTIIHEIGHALGLLHEHTRADRDQYVQIHWDRVDPGMEINFEIMEGSILLGDYDYGSIMHYGEFFFSKNGLPTIEPLRQTNAQIGQRIETSQGDREAVAELYETNLSLSAHIDDSDNNENIDLYLTVTNQTDNGANTLAITVPLPQGMSLDSYQSSAWYCYEQQTSVVVCEAPVLQGSTVSSATLTLDPGTAATSYSFDASLSSRTRDVYSADDVDNVSVTNDGDILLSENTSTQTVDVSTTGFDQQEAPEQVASLVAPEQEAPEQVASQEAPKQEAPERAEPVIAAARDSDGGGGVSDWQLLALFLTLTGFNSYNNCRRKSTVKV